jgi:nitrate/TMAO reductase-like tetraheme cytochrome c subunit
MKQMKEYFAQLRAKRKALGLCLSCGKHPSPCEECIQRNREYMRKKRAGIPVERKKADWVSKRNYYLKHKYGITEKQYDEMLTSQNFGCAICKSTNTKSSAAKRLVVDHCHSTNKVRGLLCSSCNKAIGLFEDSTEFLISAIEYLKRNHNK